MKSNESLNIYPYPGLSTAIDSYKDVSNFFDVDNIDHIKAYKHLSDTGMWTKEFVEEAEKNGYVFTSSTILLITGKICNAYVNKILNIEGN